MRRKWMFFLAPPAVALFVVIVGEIVMHLWNWLLPPLFGWHTIGFVQALGLLILSRILFGGFGGHGGPGRRHRRMQERWEQMTPEEREIFRQSMRGRCGPFSAPPKETGEQA